MKTILATVFTFGLFVGIPAPKSQAGETMLDRGTFVSVDLHPWRWSEQGTYQMTFRFMFLYETEWHQVERLVETYSLEEVTGFISFLQNLEVGTPLEVVYNYDLGPGPAVDRSIIGGVIANEKGYFLSQHDFKDTGPH